LQWEFPHPMIDFALLSQTDGPAKAAGLIENIE
jgi:hypothetical protein